MGDFIFNYRRLNLLVCLALLSLLVPFHFTHSETNNTLALNVIKRYNESLDSLKRVRLTLMRIDADMATHLKAKFDYYKEIENGGVRVQLSDQLEDPYYAAYTAHKKIQSGIAEMKSFAENYDAESILTDLSPSGKQYTTSQVNKIIHLLHLAADIVVETLSIIDLIEALQRKHSSKFGIKLNEYELLGVKIDIALYRQGLFDFLSFNSIYPLNTLPNY